MTIGVVDEVRKLGIGTKLLQQIEGLMEAKFPGVEAMYLHVVSYNTAALKFYKRNDFIKVCVLEEFYEIHGKPYDGVILYKKLGVKGDAEDNV